MAREPARRGAPSPSASPTPSTVAAFAMRRDTASPFASSPAFRDVASPMSASHASVSKDAARATLSPRPMSPAAYRLDASASGPSSRPNASASSSSRSATNAKLDDGFSTRPAERTSIRSQQGGDQTPGTRSSDKSAERSFYRRVLFQDLSPNAEAPTITHDAELDHEIYLLLAYLLRETVLPWYSKLTPDREFLTQVTSIITAIVHTITERQLFPAQANAPSPATNESDIHAPRTPAQSDLVRIHDLLSRDIPLVLRQHCQEFRLACAKAGSVWAPLGASATPPTLTKDVSSVEHDEQRRQQVHEHLSAEYQSAFLPSSKIDSASASPLQVAQLLSAACPHPGIDGASGSLDGKIDLTYLRIAVLNLLSSLMPADEFTPDTEKFIVRDVLVTLLRGALARSFRPWFLVQSMHKALDAAGWPSHPTLPSSEPAHRLKSEPVQTADTPAPASQVTASILTLISRLPLLLVNAWTFLVLRALPFVVRAYLDLFNVHREASRKRRRRQQRQVDGGSMHVRTSSTNQIPPSLSTGSLNERKMHGRYPSRKFQFGPDGTLLDRGNSSGAAKGVDETRETEPAGTVATEDVEESHPLHDYVGNWLGATEEILQVSSHALLRTAFGFVRTALGASGMDAVLNRMIVRKINAALRDTQTWTRMVQELRRILLPNGHFPPSVPDPDVETQEAEWIRLRTRLVCSPSGSAVSTSDAQQESLLARISKKMLLGSAGTSLGRGDRASKVRDTQDQLQTVTAWLAPFCSPQAAGPNTLFAILLFERVVVTLCPDLTIP
ncbi:hypothetical protein PANT_22d00258 [Moesziomyces antarcticus T-34]|uniref:PXA domain-containing protein n=1 Tax=Pseudozyma antarctica (strain T-34) TaxID=1151754 RepID=M9MIF0_PSEA3|nr:hypothetical protein PANT_22d00258 [Moesziomyces antarcticus T-34]